MPITSYFVVCSTLLLGALATHSGVTDLTRIHFPPRAMEVRLPLLSNVIELNYQNVSSVLTRVLEVEQTITALKNHMV